MIKIAEGVPVIANVSPDAPNTYFSFDVVEGQSYIFTTIGDNDTYGYLYDNNQNLITEDDDGGEDYNTSLKFTAPYTGEMIAMVRGWNADDEFEFTAQFENYATQAGETFETAIPVSIGENPNAPLSSSLNEIFYKVDVEAGKTYKIESSSDLDLRVNVYDANKEEIASDDDSGENYNFSLLVDSETPILYLKVYSYDSIPLEGATFLLNVLELSDTNVRGVTIEPNNVNVKKGETVQLFAIITPSNAENKSVLWSSDNNSIATVNADGLVTGVGLGGTYINVTTLDGGFTNSVYVKVNRMSGTGSKENPFIVMDSIDLNSVRENLNAYYLQKADIDLAGIDWEPIGTSPSRFTGTFDGDNFEIKNLYINKPDTDYVGLFGYTGTNAQLLNTTLKDVHVRGAEYVGGLAGYTSGVTAENCHVFGEVFAKGRAGVLIGIASEAEHDIKHCSSHGKVTGVGQVVPMFRIGFGGLIGQSSGRISRCFSTANVEGYVSADAGGLVGFVQSGNIYDCYSTGDVNSLGSSGYEYTFGGLIGGYRKSAVTRCYASGDIRIENDKLRVAGYIGGLIGDQYDNTERPIISNSFVLGGNIYDRTTHVDYQESSFGDILGYVSEQSNALGVDLSNNYSLASFGLITDSNKTLMINSSGRISYAQATQRTTYEATGWDFENVWTINEGVSYPTLQGMPAKETTVVQGIPMKYPFNIRRMIAN